MESSNKISSEEVSTLPNLPSEIMTEILLYLPVKSLLRLKCVCKSWLSLISSPKFIKTQLNLSTKSTTHSDYSFILAAQTDPLTYYTCPLSSILCNTSMENSRVLDFPMSKLDYELWFVGSCNGLLCVSVDPDTLVLYNPSLRNFKTLPVSGTDMETSSLMSYGLCYDQVNDDYKVVEVSSLPNGTYMYPTEVNSLRNGTYMYPTEVKVYSLRNDSWRSFGNGYVEQCPMWSNVSVGGIHYWASNGNDLPYRISAVNTVTYRCDSLATPKHPDGGAGVAEWSLGGLDGCLAVFSDYYDIRMDVWVMKEYGVEESWTKLLSVAYPGNLESSLTPLFALKNGDIVLGCGPCVLDCGPYMVFYNSRDNSFTTGEIQSIGGLCSVVSLPYIETLVAPSFVGE